MGIEPTYSAWKAAALPLSYTRPAPALRTLRVVDQLKHLALFYLPPKALFAALRNLLVVGVGFEPT